MNNVGYTSASVKDSEPQDPARDKLDRLRSRSRLSEDLTFFISALASALTFR